MQSSVESIEWGGTDRYEVRSCLGRGGMGIVYEVFDRESAQLLAAKRLLHFDPGALYLFKQEFRTLAGVVHPNLVRFYDLQQHDGGDAFFTMELVPGVDFLRYARASGTDAAQLRHVLRQLVDGVAALHAAGKLHRDIKPSNVLVTEAGRAVLLDFGVAAELSSRAPRAATSSGEVVGTAVYMAPEQGEGEPLVAASDFYSVGVMLYEALVGRPPFAGTLTDVLTMKSNADPAPPSASVAGVPADLDALCMALLQRDPSQRPDGAEIARRLGDRRDARRPSASASASASASSSASASASSTASAAAHGGEADASAFAARARHLETLTRAFAGSCERSAGDTGNAVAVRVGGGAGTGALALVQRFVERLERHREALVLRGRVYERESVPYKAVDGFVDALSAHLVALDEGGEALPLPDDVWALAQLFPVLRRVSAIAEAAAQPIVDPRAVRGRAFGALRELLGAVARRGPLVVVLDDVHWGDVDSAELLIDVLRSPGAPPLLLVVTYRELEVAESAFWRELARRWPAALVTHDISVGAIDADAPDAPRSSTLPTEPVEQPTAERLAQLPGQTRDVLEIIAVAGRPLRVAAIAAACDVASADEALALLVEQRFARVGARDRAPATQTIETSHERIREAVLSQLDDEVLRRKHARLAEALADTPGVDAEEVAEHWLAAGDRARAAAFAAKAAEHAAGTLAFERAARLYQHTIQLLPASSSALAGYRVRLAEALQYAGRSEASADAYLAAAERAPLDERTDLRREAAYQLLIGGHIARAADVLREMLSDVGLRAPRTQSSTLFWLTAYTIWSRVLGLHFRELPEGEIPAARRRRIDALYTVVGGFSMVDPLLGACLQARHMIEIHQGADVYRLVRAAALELSFMASAGQRETRRERTLLAAARALCERPGAALARRYYDNVRGITGYQRGRWAEARALLGREVDRLPYGHPGMAIVRIYSIFSDFYLDELPSAMTRSRTLLAQADDRGDLYTSVNLRSASIPATYLAEDDPGAARAAVRRALADWPKDRFSVQHWHCMMYESYIDLYCGDGAAAYERIRRGWSRVKKSFVLRGVAVRLPAQYLRVQAAIASIADAPHLARARIAEARRFAGLLDRECDPWGGLLGALGHAAADDAAGDARGAIVHLRVAIERAEATGTRLYLAPARHRFGLLLGGDAGRKMAEDALAAVAVHGVRNPERWIRWHVPGAWDSTRRATE